MKDLVEKLAKALDDEERLAREADNRDDAWWWAPDAESAAERHVAFQSPKRTLRRVAAHRKLLAMLKLDEDGDIAEVVVPGEVLCDDWCIRAVGEHLLKVLAEDHDLTDDSGSAQISRIVEELDLHY